MLCQSESVFKFGLPSPLHLKCLMSITAEAQQDLGSRAQLCCSVLDSIGGAESYRVSVS